MQIKCGNADEFEYHTHDNWPDFQACMGPDPDFLALANRRGWPGVATPPTSPKATASGPMAADSGPDTGVSVVHKDARPTGKQLFKIQKEGGSWRDAYLLNRAAASHLISQLLNPATKDAFIPPWTKPLEDDDWELFPQERSWMRGELPKKWASFDYETGLLDGVEADMSPTPRINDLPVKPAAGVAALAEARERVEDDLYGHGRIGDDEKKLRENVRTMLPLLDRVTDGYYAVKLGNGAHNDLKFFRLSRPTRGEYAGCIKLQWQLGDRWEIAWVLRKNGSMWWPVRTFSVPDYILGIISDPTGAMRQYAKMIDKCCRCNTTLTDERSRHYGIGPECEKYRPDIIALVDLEDELAKEEVDRKWR